MWRIAAASDWLRRGTVTHVAGGGGDVNVRKRLNLRATRVQQRHSNPASAGASPNPPRASNGRIGGDKYHIPTRIHRPLLR